MPGHDIICIGASAGGVEVLIELVRQLPADLPAAVFVVVHVSANSPTVLPAVLNRVGKLPASHATDDEPIRRGRIYVARPDFHLLVKDGRLRLGRGPKENSTRPAVDPLFRSAARAYGRRVVGVILSGTLDDGTVGLSVVKLARGCAIVQDPETALFPGMPRSAIENVKVDYVVPPGEIVDLLTRLAHEPIAGDEAEIPAEIKQEADMAELDESSLQATERPGRPSGFSCPECHGSLFELSDGEPIRFRCRTGHAYSAESLMAEQADNLEAAMYTAMTALKERSALSTRLAKRAEERGHGITAQTFHEQAANAERQAELIRQALLAAHDGPRSGALPGEDGDPDTLRGELNQPRGAQQQAAAQQAGGGNGSTGRGRNESGTNDG